MIYSVPTPLLYEEGWFVPPFSSGTNRDGVVKCKEHDRETSHEN
jgi:hypothetical protein